LHAIANSWRIEQRIERPGQRVILADHAKAARLLAARIAGYVVIEPFLVSVELIGLEYGQSAH
jgi:hypothetical protein